MLLELPHALFLTLLSSAPLAEVEAGPDPSDPIVVTASRTTEERAMRLGIADSDDIDRLQPASILELLNDMAGVRAFSTGGIGGGSFVSIRGGEPNFTLMLVEGIKVNDPTNSRGGAFDLLAIEPLAIERIEVARDAVSAVHGSDALSGVVNLRLRAPGPGETGPTARIQAGSRSELDLGAAFGAGWQDGGMLLAGSWFDSDDLDPGSELERRQGLGRIRQRIGGFEAQAIGLYAQTDRSGFPEDSGGPLFAVNRALETHDAELALAGLTLRRSQDAVWRPNLMLAWSRHADDIRTPAIAPGVLDGVPALAADTDFTRLEAVGDIGFHRPHMAATVGAAWQRESGRSRGTIDFGFPVPTSFDLDRETRSLFAEATLRPADGLVLNLAGRHDRVAGGPSSSTGRAGLSYQPGASSPLLFARIGTGYKLPSLFALGHPLIGNPGLRPERSRNIELGAEWRRAANLLVRFTLFDNRFRDLIDFDPILFTTVNRDRVQARGVELEGQAAIRPMLALSAALTWLDLDSPTPLRGRPRWQGSARLVWQASTRLELNTAARANSSYNDSSIPTGPVIADGHAEWDVGLRYRLSAQLGIDAALRNITDSRHQDAVGFPAPGRLLRVTLTAGF